MRARVQLVVRDDLVGEPDPQRLVGPDLAAGDAQLLGAARADQPGEALCAAPAGDDAEQDLRLAEHGPLAGDAVVAGERQLAAAAERVPGHGGDHHARDRRHRVERAVDGGRDRPRLVGAAELGDVGAGGEDLLAAGDDNGAGRIGAEADRDLVQPAHDAAREGVDLAVVRASRPPPRRRGARVSPTRRSCFHHASSTPSSMVSAAAHGSDSRAATASVSASQRSPVQISRAR